MKQIASYIKFLLSVFVEKSRKVKSYLVARCIIFPWQVFDIIKKDVDFKEKTIMDIWCGYWIVPLFFIHQKRPIKYIKGIDIDSKRIKDLQQLSKKHNRDHLKFEVYDLIKHWPNNIENTDIALLFDLLHHIDKKTQDILLEHLSQITNTIIIKDIGTKPKRKYNRNFFHDRYLMGNKILCFQWKEKIKEKLESLWYQVIQKKIKSLFPYPHYLLIAQKI